jgi:REP element-mobilizing transposase RayT
MTIRARRTGWLDEAWFSDFRTRASVLVKRYNVAIPALVVMPDHLHLLVSGTSHCADQLLFVRALRRQINARLPTNVELQKQAYDHVLRKSESSPEPFTAMVHYICENPVRQKLVLRAQDWNYTDTVAPGWSLGLKPTSEGFRQEWWKWWNQKVSESV